MADAILFIHAFFVLFIVFGLVAIYAGYFLKWRWVRNRSFRILHLIAILIVMVQSWLGIICPLTVWEVSLRTEAGQAGYSGSFMQHWVQHLLYYNAPEWVFILLYTSFGSLVVGSWFIVRPHPRT
nr:DUF2784 domain-containing protein [Alteromonas sp. ASW11-130]